MELAVPDDKGAIIAAGHSACAAVGVGCRVVQIAAADPRFVSGGRWVPPITHLRYREQFVTVRNEVKTNTNDFEFIGLQVGGSIASGAQGVYAVLPFEAGLSHYPLTTPGEEGNTPPPRRSDLRARFQRPPPHCRPKPGTTPARLNPLRSRQMATSTPVTWSKLPLRNLLYSGSDSAGVNRERNG
jgi:hypothetical protein